MLIEVIFLWTGFICGLKFSIVFCFGSVDWGDFLLLIEVIFLFVGQCGYFCVCLNIRLPPPFLIVHIFQEKQRIKRQQQNKKIELSDLKSGEILILT